MKEKNPENAEQSGGIFPRHNLIHSSGARLGTFEEQLLERCEHADWNEAIQNLPEHFRRVFFRRQIADSLALACKELTPKERLLLLWRYQDGLQLGQIAELLGIHQLNVTRRLERMQTKLREHVIATLAKKYSMSGPAIQECLNDIVENPRNPISILRVHNRYLLHNAVASMTSQRLPADGPERAEVRETAAGSADVVRDLGQNQSVQRAIEEETVAQNYVVHRYQTLVDRKYVQGLSSQETEEFEALRTTLDALDQPFYERLIARVRMLVEEEGANA